jgi:hypothetical protein
MMIGISAIVSAAICSVRLAVSMPTKLASPSGNVFSDDELIKTSANKYSFQLYIKFKITTVEMAGRVIGKMIYQKILNTPAPSMTPDSSRSFGNPLMKPSRIKIVNDKWKAV